MEERMKFQSNAFAPIMKIRLSPGPKMTLVYIYVSFSRSANGNHALALT